MKIGQPGQREIALNGKVVGHFEATGDYDTDSRVALAELKRLGYDQSSLPQWKHIRQQAMDFRDACGLIMNYDLGKRDPSFRPLSIPYVVNTAFCLELYLKAISLRHGSNQKGHDLLKIYDNLPDEAISSISARIDEAKEETRYDGETNERDLLSVIKDSFCQWRYAHESAHLGAVMMQPLFFLRALLHRSCLNDQ